ncbi:hypothetical protein LJB87_01455, partial [Alistipes sp. OttesenSCG-928-L06]|nr:hypothetical protein [Alistipes sp. OttesenSCG-928-L06]
LILLGVSLCGCGKNNSPNVDTLAAFEQEFANPSREFRSAPFFVWNSDTKKSDIDRAMEEFKRIGAGGGFIHPRMGMITEYLSDDWWELCEYTLQRGKELGIDVWLYDENGFPSGQGGGLVQELMPESYTLGNALIMKRVDVMPEMTKDYTVVLKKEGGKFADITATAAAEAGKTGEYYIFEKQYMPPSPRWGGFPYVNLLEKGVTDKFIEITMPGYEKHIGADFGTWVPGIFTDEPHIRPTTGATWFSDMFERFEARWGYDLRPELPKLFDEVGDDWRRVRHNYRKFLLEMKEERWARPWREYTDAHNLKWTGHYWEHAWPNPHVSPDYLMMYTYHHVPGIDILFNQYDEKRYQAQFGNVRAVREVQSVADQMGYPRTVCEIYAGAGWEFSFFDMKRQADWINVLGINFLTQHYTPVSIKGVRKLDYPEVFSYQLPWWPWYQYLGEYHARVSLAMAAGEHVNDILLLEPTTSAWMYFIRGENKVGYRIGEIAQPFQKVVTALESNQVEYDIASEAVMNAYASVIGDQLRVNQRYYRTVVVPSTMENIEQSTFDFLKTYVANGGKLLLIGDGPTYLEGVEAKAELSAFFNGAGITREPELTVVAMNRHLRNDKIRFADDVADRGRLYHQRRDMKDGQIVMLNNVSDSVTVSGDVVLAGADALLFDAMTGAVTDYPETPESDGKIRVRYELAPAANMLLYVTRKKTEGYAPAISYADLRPVEPASEIRVNRQKDNVLVIDWLDQTLDGRTRAGLHAYDADNQAFRHNGFTQGNPWFFSAMHRTSFLDHKFPEDSELTNAYHFTVTDDFDYSGMTAVVERANHWKIEINGHEVKPAMEQGEMQWWVDVDFGVVPIGQYVRKGVNTITTSVSPMTVHHETMPIYILGDFSVNPAKTGFAIGKPAGEMSVGSWKEQGMPHYSHEVNYSRTFHVERIFGPQYDRDEGNGVTAFVSDPLRFVVELDDWRGTVAAVYVNGTEAGIIGWPPYRLDVTGLVVEGDNTVEVKVVGSFKNLFGQFYVPARGQINPSLMKRAPEEQPAPEVYDLFDYGLFGDIRLLEQ